MNAYFVEEQATPEYGIPRQIHSHNPLTLNFHEWKDMFHDLRSPGLTFRQRVEQVTGPPEVALKTREKGAGKTEMERVKGIEPSS